MSTLREMENQLALALDARYPQGHRLAGQLRYDHDERYKHAVAALRVQVETQRQAEASAPQINADQLRWLERVRSAKTADGRVPLLEISAQATKLRSNLQRAHAQILSGKSLTAEQIAATERDLAAQGAVMPATAPSEVLPTARQRQAAHEGGFSLGVPQEWSGGAGSPPVTTTLPSKA